MGPRYDFANILLSGRCNLRCPRCIGRSLPVRLQPDNLRRFPLPGLDRFIAAVQAAGIKQVTLTGSNTDPQLYRHEARLLRQLRRRLPGVALSLHTNGLMAGRRPQVFNSYDRATVSVPSLEVETCRVMTGGGRPLDLERIVSISRIPLKVSILVSEHNVAEIPRILQRCRALGLRRVSLRLPYGETRDRGLLRGHAPARWFRGLPVFDLAGLEVTIWDFSRVALRCLNLFGDGTISADYELSRQAGRSRVSMLGGEA